MQEPQPRADLLRGLLQSCYVTEQARMHTQLVWGGPFERDAEFTGKRAARLGRLLDELSIRRPDEVVEPHTDWWLSLVGKHPDEVLLGATALHTLGRWSDAFVGPYLGPDFDDFRQWGAEYTSVRVEFKGLPEEQAFLPELPLPEGRRFVVLTDIHIGPTYHDALARCAVEDINAIDPEFVVVPGDITEDAEPEQFVLAKEILDGLRCPYYVVLGNHDTVRRSTRRPFGGEFLAEIYGRQLRDEVIECGGLQVALVDSTDPTVCPFPEWDITTGRTGGEAAGVPSGALHPGQAEELAERLDPRLPVLLVQHHELHPFPGFPPVNFALREEDAEAELDALSGHRLVGVVAGHTHRSAVLEVGSGRITQLEVPALATWPFGFAVVGVTDHSVRVVVRQVSDRDTIWRSSRGLPPLMTRYAVGSLSDLDYTFSL